MSNAHLRQFLLRRLPADEVARLEEAILVENGFAERLRDEEFDLLDDYAASRLNAEDAADVERYLLGSAETLHSLRIARALQSQRVLRAEPKPLVGAPIVNEPSRAEPDELRSFTRRRSRKPQIARVATLMAACLVVVLVIPRWRSIAVRPDAASTVIDIRSGASSAISGISSDPASDLPIVSLVADVNRGSTRSSLKIAEGASAVRLQAEVPEHSPDALYGIRIDDAQGHRLFEGTGLSVRAAGPYRFVETVVPAAALWPGDRTVSLTGAGAESGAAVTFSWDVTGGIASRPKR